MSEAVKLMVNAYVAINDRTSLEQMRTQRLRMRNQLQEKIDGAFNMSRSIEAFDEDINVIEAALKRL